MRYSSDIFSCQPPVAIAIARPVTLRTAKVMTSLHAKV